jgi:glycosyltransferase involved in cell wall biosynthesis
MNTTSIDIAVVIPCYNEAVAIGRVVEGFRASLPQAAIHVFDNSSSDDTAGVARRAGAVVHHVGLRGKGNVVRRMFADVDADVYVMVDGDDTYEAAAAPLLVAKLLDERLDMVVGRRLSDETAAYRAGHRTGNLMLTRAAAMVFGSAFDDLLSGYRVFSRRFAKSFPAHSAGFEIETELAVHALGMRMPVAEVPTAYGARPEGSHSKLSTYRDGFRILMTIARLVKAERPLAFFSVGFGLCFLLAVALALPLLFVYLETGLVPRLPTAVLSAALVLLAFILLGCGLILDTVTRGRWETKRMAYLAVAGPKRPGA